MTATTTSAIPASDVDPFCHEVLEDPLPFHAALRDAGPVVHLTRYDLYAMGRYEHVHAALIDWQRLPVRRRRRADATSGTRRRGGRRACCWRPTRPTTTRPARCWRRSSARGRCAGCASGWFADAEELVDELLATRAGEVDAVPALAEAFPLRVFPDAVGIAREGREHLLPYGDHLFNAFGPANDLVVKGRHRAPAEHAGVGQRPVRARGARRRRVRRRDLGRRRPRRHHARAGAAGRAVPALGRGRHHRARPRRRASTRSPPTPRRGSGCAPTRRWRGSRSTRPCAGSRRCRRSSAPPTPTSPWATPSSPTGAKILMFLGVGQPRPPALGRPRPLRPRPRPFRPRRVRHGHPPVRRPARGPPRGRGPAHRAGRAASGRSSSPHPAPPPQQHHARLRVAPGRPRDTWVCSPTACDDGGTA